MTPSPLRNWTVMTTYPLPYACPIQTNQEVLQAAKSLAEYFDGTILREDEPEPSRIRLQPIEFMKRPKYT